MSDWGVKAVTIDAFWQQIAEAINGECDECPVYQYAVKTNTKRMCDLVCVCAEGLMALHEKLQEEEREKQDSLNELPW